MEIHSRSQLGELCKHLGMLTEAAEVGVAEGNFSKDLLNMGFTKLYMVDNWGTIEGVRGDGNFPQDWHDENLKKAKQQTSSFGERRIILKGLSKEMANHVPDNSLGLVYLDAGHDYTSVWFDLVHWFPKLKQGGIMAGHDYTNPDYGVHQAVNDWAARKNIKVNLISENGGDASFWFQKC